MNIFIVFQRKYDLMFQVNPLLYSHENQALLSAKDKSKKLKCLLQFSFGALRVKSLFFLSIHFQNRFLQPTALIYLRDIVGLTQIL